MELIQKFEKGLVVFEKTMVFVFTITMLVSMSLGIAARYLFHGISLTWTEELSVISFVLLSFYGAAFAYYHGKHLGIDNLVHKLSRKNYKRLWYVKKIIIILFLTLVMLRYGIPVALGGLEDTYSVIPIQRFYVQINIPIFGLLVILHSVFSMIRKDYDK